MFVQINGEYVNLPLDEISKVRPRGEMVEVHLFNKGSWTLEGEDARKVLEHCQKNLLGAGASKEVLSE